MGFRDYYKAGKTSVLPRMIGFQAEGAAPIVRGSPVEKPETVATAIRIGNPARWKEAEEAAGSSGGSIDMVSDEEILAAYRMLAAGQGIFVEPASAASVAGVIKRCKQKKFKGGELVVCVLTGHGLKDPNIAIKVGGEIIHCKDSVESVEKVIEGIVESR